VHQVCPRLHASANPKTRPESERVFVAGEACGPSEFNGSFPSAFISGLKASRNVQESLAREAIPVEAR
jgi:hypothetical protein